MPCVKCAFDIPAGLRFCPQCGTVVAYALACIIVARAPLTG